MSNQPQLNLYDEQDLIELVKAIKFAYPDYSVQSVHQEIIDKLSKTAAFEFLSTVKVCDIERVWDKALEPNSSRCDQRRETESSSTPFKDEVVRFYTIGDGSVKKLAGSYSLEAAAEVKSKHTDSGDIDGTRYVHCFLDVPADLTGTKPYQALINFNDVDHEDSTRKGANVGKEIVKIQTAAAIPGYGPTPMLLYNKDRTYKTFIHPPKDSTSSVEDGYNLIRNKIDAFGVGGVLNGGGKKGYFYARVSNKTIAGQSIISVDVSTGMAPAQIW